MLHRAACDTGHRLHNLPWPLTSKNTGPYESGPVAQIRVRALVSDGGDTGRGRTGRGWTEPDWERALVSAVRFRPASTEPYQPDSVHEQDSPYPGDTLRAPFVEALHLRTHGDFAQFGGSGAGAYRAPTSGLGAGGGDVIESPGTAGGVAAYPCIPSFTISSLDHETRLCGGLRQSRRALRPDRGVRP